MCLFVLQKGNYSIGDPSVLLDEDQFRELSNSNPVYGSFCLETDNGTIIAPKVGKIGVLDTNIDRSLETQSGSIAIVPEMCVRRKNLIYQSIEVSFNEPTMMFAVENVSINIFDTLIIYCTDDRPEKCKE